MVSCPAPVGRPGGWLAAAVSLLLHGSLLLLLFAGGLGLSSSSPFSSGYATVTDGDGLDLTLVEVRKPRQPVPAPSEPFVARVVDPPAIGPVDPPSALPTMLPGGGGEESEFPGAANTANGAAGGESVGGGTSGGGPATFFGVAVEGKRVVYVIDRSISMGLSGSLVRAKAELLASLRKLTPGCQFQVVLYSRSAQTLQIAGGFGLQPVNDQTRDEVARRLAAVRAEGATDHLVALRRGLALEPDVLFLATDADDLSPEVVRNVTRINHGRTVIHTIDVNPRHTGTQGTLAALSRANGGNHHVARH